MRIPCKSVGDDKPLGLGERAVEVTCDLTSNRSRPPPARAGLKCY